MAFKWPPKDPNEVLDYTHNFGPRLDPGDEIIAAAGPDEPVSLVDVGDVVIQSHAMENDPDTGDQTVMRVWLSGGTVKETGEPENLTLRVKTVAGRTLDEGINIIIKDR